MRTIERFADVPGLQRAAANKIVQLLREAVTNRGKATMVLSGGSTPKGVYELLGAEPLRSHVDWSRTHVFWGDERCVPPAHHESNFRMVNEALLKRIPIPQVNIHRIEAEREPGEAARLYENELRSFSSSIKHEYPRFDVTLLGMGEDGHTASLFPETTIVNETERSVAEVFVPKFSSYRISMTFPTLNNSRTVLFLVSGSGKRQILREVLEGAPNRYPSQKILPSDGSCIWFADEAAAQDLSSV